MRVNLTMIKNFLCCIDFSIVLLMAGCSATKTEDGTESSAESSVSAVIQQKEEEISSEILLQEIVESEISEPELSSQTTRLL